MFEFIRTHRRLVMMILMLLIVPSFVLVGVSGYESGDDSGNVVATVGGQKISRQEWEEAQRQQMDRYRQAMGAQFDQKMLDTPEAKQAILDNLVAERALGAEIARSHLTVSETTLAKAIADIEMFRKPDGSFDMEQYKAVLAAQGMTPEMFDARMRRDMAMQQINSAVQNTAFAPRTVSKRLSDINDEEREVQELLFPAAEFTSQVKVTDEMVKAYYDKNAALFQIPEQVKVEYVVFDADVVESQVSVTDAEVSDYYAKNQKRFGTDEQRTASHILINANKDASAADKAAAKAKADAILAELRKAPGEFARVAKAQSQDPASAELGGELGVIEKGT
jgi:peptidyl-prolyl cis-trans isomerase D